MRERERDVSQSDCSWTGNRNHREERSLENWELTVEIPSPKLVKALEKKR